MSRRSLFVRLGFAAALLIALALALAGVGITLIVDRQMERRAVAELDLQAKALAAQLRVDASGALALDVTPADPRFEQPYSGLYWQIDGPRGASLRSRSLWDSALPAAEPLAPGAAPHSQALAGPEGSRLIAVRRAVVLDAPNEPAVHIAVALDEADLAAERRAFLGLLVPSLAALALALSLAMATFLYLALRPLRSLRDELREIHAGLRKTLSRDVPDEVKAVVDDLNRLIGLQDAALERAQTQAGDLAHGLKTPLAVLGALARGARRQDDETLAAGIEEQASLMRHHVDRALARARAGMTAAVGQRSTDVARVIGKILRALRTLPDADALDWEVSIPAELRFGGDEGDLTELLGNLLDNARKWATGRVLVTATADEREFMLRIEDDGPGLPEEEAIRIERGKRWDESQPGTGFGLAIARDLVEAYRGTLRLSRSPLGGLAVSISLPGAPAS